jgi:hypothetical protein
VAGLSLGALSLWYVVSDQEPDLTRLAYSPYFLPVLFVFSVGVQCNVSLVGQWIEEAKSKLKDPGLVYSYHGGGRNRNPKTLAANSIVVTTYETLASDATYHANRSSLGAKYAGPCEQVRWWRIICDESHSIRSRSIKSDAVLELVADNKWLVSGKSNLGLPFCSLLCHY